MIFLLLLLAVIFVSTGVTEGMDQRLTMNDKPGIVYHIFRTIATWSIVIGFGIGAGKHWQTIAIAFVVLDALYNRVLQGVRVFWIDRNGSIHDILTACDINHLKPVPFWAWGHYYYWIDWMRIIFLPIAALWFHVKQ